MTKYELTEEGNQPAFPVGQLGESILDKDGRIGHRFNGCKGLSIREWYAGMALQGMLACHTTQRSVESYAEWAFKHADAMIKASYE